MILTRTPLRLSFLGGGSDLPLFYQQEEGAALSTTINKYVYTSLKPQKAPGIHVTYAKVEKHVTVDMVDHPIIRMALKNFDVDVSRSGLSVMSTADVVYGTGLGGSSSFTVGLVHALSRYSSLAREFSPYELAMEASRIEIEQLHQPIGRQDHFAAAFGGLSLFRFLPSGEIRVEKVTMSAVRRRELEASILLFFTGASRSASAVLLSYRERLTELRASIRDMKDLAIRLKTVLEADDQPTNQNSDLIADVGGLLHEGWLCKRDWSAEISNPAIDDLYERGRQAGALGGKIVGAGGGGFLMLIVRPEDQVRVKSALSELQLLPVQFTQIGSELLTE